MRDEDEGSVSREIVLTFTGQTVRAMRSIGAAFPALQDDEEILNLAINKLDDAEGIWRHKCEIVGVDKAGIIHGVLQRKMPDEVYAAAEGQQLYRLDTLQLTYTANRILENLKCSYGTESEDKLVGLAFDNLVRIVDMRAQKLRIFGIDEDGTPIFEMEHSVLDQAEESMKVARGLFLTNIGLKKPGGPTG